MMKLVVLFAFLAVVQANGTTTCSVGSNLCECKGVNFTIDISAYADFPIYKIPDLSPPGFDVYIYTYSPCELVACTKGGPVDSYSCQYGYNHTFSNARKAPMQWEVNQWEPLQFTLLYQGGDPILSYERLMQVTFTYADSKPVVVMESNNVTDKYIYYNFNFTGNVVKFT